MAEADYEFLKFDESKSPLKKKLAAARAEEARGANKGGGGGKLQTPKQHKTSNKISNRATSHKRGTDHGAVAR